MPWFLGFLQPILGFAKELIPKKSHRIAITAISSLLGIALLYFRVPAIVVHILNHFENPIQVHPATVVQQGLVSGFVITTAAPPATDSAAAAPDQPASDAETVDLSRYPAVQFPYFVPPPRQTLADAAPVILPPSPEIPKLTAVATILQNPLPIRQREVVPPITTPTDQPSQPVNMAVPNSIQVFVH
jgi:hypothetical protein